MIWLTCATDIAPTLPAVWLIASEARPRDLGERSRLRRETALRLLAGQFSLPPEAVALDHDERGRPLLLRPAGTGLHLSLATRGGLVACALARGPVGVDVERIDPLSTTPLDALHPDERAALLALPEPARPLAFTRLWAAKEAYVKALGTGFVRPPESFAAALTGEDGFAITDPQRPGAITGHSRIIGNGGQETLAAAMVVLT